MSSPELSVVCRQCGEEVSPYVTECPYCGTRLRKRAPKLTRGEEGFTPLESKRDKRRRRRRERAAERAEAREGARLSERPIATLVLIVAPALLLLCATAASLDPLDTGAIAGAVGDEWWRYVTAPFSYPDVGYLFAAAVGIAIFGHAVEQRLGTVATLLLAVAAGSLGMLAADAVETAIGSDELLLASGGNGVALGLLSAWAVIKASEVRAGLDEHPEVIGAAIAAGALVLLPLVEDFASIFAGIAGALVGAVCGLIATRGRSAGTDRA